MAQHGRNRSDRLQLYLAGNIVLVAMREISPGEDLTTDYTIFDGLDGEMDCRRHSASCRGKISGRDWQRPELQRKYGDYFSTCDAESNTSAISTKSEKHTLMPPCVWSR